MLKTTLFPFILGADINFTCEDKQMESFTRAKNPTPLDYAAFGGFPNTLNLLLDKGAVPTAQTLWNSLYPGIVFSCSSNETEEQFMFSRTKASLFLSCVEILMQRFPSLEHQLVPTQPHTFSQVTKFESVQTVPQILQSKIEKMKFNDN